MTGESHFARAVLLFLLAGLCLSSLDATAKYLVRSYPVEWCIWARYAGHLLMALPLAWTRVGSGFWRSTRPFVQGARSALLLVTSVCFFVALQYLPLADASAISFLAPLFVVVLSGPLLGETVPKSRWIAVAIGFGGILLVTRPGAAAFHPAALLMLAMAFCNALYQMLTGKLASDSPYTTLFYSAVPGAIAFTLALPFLPAHPLPGAFEALLFVLLGLLGGLGHWCITRAFLQAQASQLTPFGYLQ